ncbi:DUF2306 domain-containing protein [Candidimonas humi]|uniref:DUF2306 domain-containing protein n=1 Tax=Candidimonas humi TaxID=683355 RepID=A0ABV8NW50_9BURK|nr:DUF2306 domain-containing protein [Candidimonas humi]MBV6305921.1 DUF2306 domain-containing protein [Candidimonas humi]
MSLAPLTSASAVIQVHAWAAIFALALGVVVLARRKGTPSHRWSGRIWAAAMLVAVLSSFFIHELRTWGQWSPIHILSVITLVLLVRAYVAIRQRKVQLHAELMKATFYNALLLATFFTFLPGRIMHDVVFGPSPEAAGAVPMWVWIVGGVVVVMGGRHLAAKWHRKTRAAAGAG